ncbi:MAG TPA: hypothetical protein VLB84_21035, partial [Bacteroidia bacterium]|nr:hypothetical protein [Bacteroidia bacterium]
MLSFIVSQQTQAQYREFAFNKPGNDCYIEYISYTSNNDYINTKRPFIFILGKSGETAIHTWENDSLKNLPQFYNYRFIYIPFKSG